jgi:ribosomal protein L40E
MPRWEAGRITKRMCPKCGGRKDFHAVTCRGCSTPALGHPGKKGPNHPAWKGGVRIDRDGYLRRYLPDHPWPRKSGYVHEHVAVMELSLGRRLAAGEVVHHKNHEKQDNRFENLELQTAGAHSSHHRQLDVHLRKRDIRGRFGPKEDAR